MVGFGFILLAASDDFCSRIERAAQRAGCRADDCAFGNLGQSIRRFGNHTFRPVIYCFFFAEELLDVDDLAVDFVAGLADLLVADAFEPVPDDLLADAFEADDLLAVDFEPELDDLPADGDLLVDDLDALPVDLPAIDFPVEDDFDADGFAAVFEPEDLLVDVDFAAGLAEDDLLLPLAEDDLLAVDLLPVVVDFVEFLFVVAIAISLKFFLQLTQEFLR